MANPGRRRRRRKNAELLLLALTARRRQRQRGSCRSALRAIAITLLGFATVVGG